MLVQCCLVHRFWSAFRLSCSLFVSRFLVTAASFDATALLESLNQMQEEQTVWWLIQCVGCPVWMFVECQLWWLESELQSSLPLWQLMFLSSKNLNHWETHNDLWQVILSLKAMSSDMVDFWRCNDFEMWPEDDCPWPSVFWVSQNLIVCWRMVVARAPAQSVAFWVFSSWWMSPCNFSHSWDRCPMNTCSHPTLHFECETAWLVSGHSPWSAFPVSFQSVIAVLNVSDSASQMFHFAVRVPTDKIFCCFHFCQHSETFPADKIHLRFCKTDHRPVLRPTKGNWHLQMHPDPFVGINDRAFHVKQS